MILDTLETEARLRPLNRGFEKAFEFLLKPDLKDLPVGRYDIEDDRVHAIVSIEPGRKREDAKLETHSRHIDIQLVLDGTDTMGWKPASACREPASGYDEKADIRFFSDEPDAWVSVHGGEFAVFFPEDAHMPLISDGLIHKVIVKVKAEN